MDSETQQAFKDSARDLIGRGDPARRRALMLSGGGNVDRSAWRQMAEAGWTAVLVSEGDGGLGLGLSEVTAIAEEAGRAAIPEPFVASAIQLGIALSAARETAVAQDLIEALIGGELIAGVAWQDEPGQVEPRSDGGLRYVREADGVVLDGARHFVSPVAGADGWVVLASGAEGPALVWVRADTPNLTVQVIPQVSGVPSGSLILEQSRVASANMLLLGDGALAAVAGASDAARIAYSAELVGIAQATLDATLEYMNTRTQFGKPIGAFQALQHRLVDAYMQVELAASAVRDASSANLDIDRERRAAASRAKARSAQAALHVVRLAIQLHGAIGYTEEGPVGAYLQRAITLAAQLGNEAAHRRRYFENRPLIQRDSGGESAATLQTEFPQDADWDAMSDKAFRQMLRDFFATHYPEPLRHAPRRLHWHEIGDWYRTLARQGWIAPAWPKEYGGMALPPDKLIAYIEEQEFHGVGRPPDQGLIMLGPILFRYGTQAQRERFLPKILSGEHVWAQGYSEPNAGSDLASLRTQATLDGDVFIVNGQKTWSTLAQDATHMFMLVRTDNSGKKQHGISFLLVDLKSPGVTVRPIRTIAGDEEFCEVFFDDVRVPAENLVGDIHKGWDIAKQLLGFERIFSGSPKHSQSTLEQVRELAEARGLLADAAWADRYAQALLDVADLGSAYANFAEMVKRGETLPPQVSYLKIWATETHERVAMLLNDMAAESTMYRGTIDAGDKPVDVHMPLYSALAAKIFSGSNEIQRNILAKQVLGLPT